MLVDIDPAEKEYRWLDAAKSYEQTLQSKPESAPFAAEFWKRIGYCYALASRQAESVEEFKRLEQLSVEAYEKAAELFREGNQGQRAECLSIAEYIRSWITSNVEEKKQRFDKCRALGKIALEAFKNAGDELNYGKTCSMLSECLFNYLSHVSLYATNEERGKIVREAIGYADEAISVFSKLGQRAELLGALIWASLISWFLAFFMVVEREEARSYLEKKCLSYSKEALKISTEVDDLFHKVGANLSRGLSSHFCEGKIFEAMEYFKEAIQQASFVRDNHLKGSVSWFLAFATFRISEQEADTDRRKQLGEEAIEHAEDAIRYSQPICRNDLVARSYYIIAQVLPTATEFAANPSEKARALALSKEAIRIGEKTLEYAASGVPQIGSTSSIDALSRAYHLHSKLEPGKKEKKELLKTALGHGKEYVRLIEKTLNPQAIGEALVKAAQIEADLASLEEDEKTKVNLLEQAISDTAAAVAAKKRWIETHPRTWLIAVLAADQDMLGRLLTERYHLTKNKEDLTKANEAYRNAAEDFKIADMPNRVAECYWKIAWNLDNLGEHQKAAQNFENAFAGYKAAAQRLPQLSDFYLNYATYMKAWSQIQTAKEAHRSQKYDTAMQHYEATANLLKPSKLWNYLAPNFLAWSLLEHAEDLSRNENCEESISTFKKAIVFFQQSKQTLQAAMEKIEKEDEKTFATQLAEATEVREQFGHGRIAIEEAKILDKQGNHTASSEKYGSAAAIFQKVSQASVEQIGGEAKPLVYLCQAWQKMTMAEAKGSPPMYAEAAGLFKLANEHTPTESESLLALGHSSFCKALEAGTEFENTRNMAMYTVTSRYMDAAASHYLKAGFESSSEYAKATQRLFDAYVFMDSAKRETDPEKQTKYYLMAEKVLQISAEAFAKAGYPAKTDQVDRLLRKVREEKELAITLSEVFHAPPITSTTTSFSAISPTTEKAVGLERFEHADIEAVIVQDKSEVKLGEDVSLDIGIANVGREAVVLTKIENIAPVDFQLVGKPNDSSIEDMHLVMKRKRLDQLESTEMKVALRPLRRGTFEIQPRIVCVDEIGRQLFFKPEPAALTVS